MKTANERANTTAVIAPGARYGSLVYVAAVEQPRYVRGGGHWAEFRCDCGRLKRVRVSSVTSGGTRSCGCRMQLAMRRLMNAAFAENVARKRGAR